MVSSLSYRRAQKQRELAAQCSVLQGQAPGKGSWALLLGTLTSSAVSAPGSWDTQVAPPLDLGFLNR